ncbi:MAG: VWA domain-containing protein [Spirochaetales bacterium]|nr:VWA domain-containing protein [Spirochaetales bacterium]
MKIMQPEYFSLLFLLPLLWIISFIAHRRSLFFLKNLGYVRGNLIDSQYRIRGFIRFLLLNGIFVFSVLGLVDFHWGLQPEHSDRKNLDIALVFDVSNSMLAQDVGGSRLDRCRDAVYLLMENLPRSRYSFTLFKGEPVLFIPLTEDRIILENLLAGISPSYLSSPGSNLEKALIAAKDTLPANQERHRAVLLFTDGDNLEGNAIDGARRLYNDKIRLFVFGIGTEEGSQIRLSDGSLLSDRSGNIVTSRQNKALLQEMAQITDGGYLDLTEVHQLGEIGDVLSQAYGEMETRGIGSSAIPRYRLFYGMVLLLLVMYAIQGKLRWN